MNIHYVQSCQEAGSLYPVNCWDSIKEQRNKLSELDPQAMTFTFRSKPASPPAPLAPSNGNECKDVTSPDSDKDHHVDSDNDSGNASYDTSNDNSESIDDDDDDDESADEVKFKN